MRNWMVAAWVTGALAGCAKSEPAAPAEAPAAAPAAAEGTGAAPAAEAPKAAEGTGAAPAEPGGAADTWLRFYCGDTEVGFIFRGGALHAIVGDQDINPV